MFKIIIGVVICTIIAIVIFTTVEKFGNVIGVDDTANSLSQSDDALTVTISGEVTRPGTYLLDLNTTLESLIKAASGTTSNADSKAYNTDYALEDGMSFYIAPLYDNDDRCAVTPISKVNINADDKATMMGIEAIGTTLAQSIIDYRENTKTFKRLEEIKNVSGIGTATFEKVKDRIVLKENS